MFESLVLPDDDLVDDSAAGNLAVQNLREEASGFHEYIDETEIVQTADSVRPASSGLRSLNADATISREQNAAKASTPRHVAKQVNRVQKRRGFNKERKHSMRLSKE